MCLDLAILYLFSCKMATDSLKKVKILVLGDTGTLVNLGGGYEGF